MGYIAFQYAEALHNIAVESNTVKSLLDDFKTISELIDEEIYKFLNHPKISKKNKKEIIQNSIENDLLMRFMFVLIDNSRISLLKECFSEFEKIVDSANKVMNIQVFSKKMLSVEEMNQLNTNLKKRHKKKIILDNIVDQAIIGGLRIEYDGMILDDTINNYLDNLKFKLTKWQRWEYE